MIKSDLKMIRAETADVETLVELSRAYHAFENISLSDEVRRRGLSTLIANPSYGVVWLVMLDGEVVGYMAICIGFSIEFGGRDAFVDEFYLIPEVRGKGVGTFALDEGSRLAREMGLIALNLEVDRDNEIAKRAYISAGFKPREKYLFMSKELVDVGHSEG